MRYWVISLMTKKSKLSDLYSDKQISVLKRTRSRDWFMLVLHGAVRSGKTIVDNDIFLAELMRAKANAQKDGNDPMYILGATSAGTLQTNVLKELSSKYGIEFKFDRYGNFTLFGVYVVTTFTGSIAGLKSIRGMTAYGAYINEATLANKEVFNEILKRLSGNGARIICDTNPDHPNHWFKVDYIDKADDERIVAYHFEIFDNPFLNQRYVDNVIATTPSGVFTERGIYGLWVSGEGAVYRDFDKEKHFITAQQLPTQLDYFIGVDWGYEHHGVIVVVGEDVQGNYYLVEEHARQHKEIDYWVEEAERLQKVYGTGLAYYSDPARPEHIARFQREGLGAQNASNAVVSGIEQVARLFKNDQLFVVEDNVTLFHDEIYQYVWDANKDAPVKKHDDVMDALRYAIYSRKVTEQSRNAQPVTQRISQMKRVFG